MKEGVQYTVHKEIVVRSEILTDGRKSALIFRSRDFGGDSLEPFRLNRYQDSDGVLQEQKVTLPRRSRSGA